MPESWGVALIVLAGGVLTVGSTAVAGFRIHRWLLRHAPQAGRLLPRDAAVAAGILIGVITVALWFVQA